MGVESQRNCTKEGRRARAIIRTALDRSIIPFGADDALKHIKRCDHCKGRIDDAIQHNPERTVYYSSVQETIEAAETEIIGGRARNRISDFAHYGSDSGW